MIIKLRMVEMDISKREIKRIVKFLNSSIDKVYYLDGIEGSYLNPDSILTTKKNINYCKNKDGKYFIKYKKDKYIVTKEFIKDNFILESLGGRKV